MQRLKEMAADVSYLSLAEVVELISALCRASSIRR